MTASSPPFDVIAVDFDGVLVTDAYPLIGLPRYEIIERLRIRQAQGAKVILWTCRVGLLLDAAVEWCRDAGIHLDAVNCSISEWVKFYGGGDPRKVGATEYWDDRAVNCAANVEETEDGPQITLAQHDYIAMCCRIRRLEDSLRYETPTLGARLRRLHTRFKDRCRDLKLLRQVATACREAGMSPVRAINWIDEAIDAHKRARQLPYPGEEVD